MNYVLECPEGTEQVVHYNRLYKYYGRFNSSVPQLKNKPSNQVEQMTSLSSTATDEFPTNILSMLSIRRNNEEKRIRDEELFNLWKQQLNANAELNKARQISLIEDSIDQVVRSANPKQHDFNKNINK